ncbi:MAG: hypothetical protein V1696_01920 [Candidatus Jorgensenbacteria bacterium]
MKALMIILLAFAAPLVVGAQEKNPATNSAFSFELEILSVGMNIFNTNPQIKINEIPLYLRTVPIHGDDPDAGEEIVLSNNAPVFYSMTSLRMATFKVWLFSTLGFGVGCHRTGFSDAVFILNKEFGEEKFNYAPRYGPDWGAAYVHYYFSTKEELKISFLAELKTPSLILWSSDDRKDEFWKTNLFVGYQPQKSESFVVAKNGWDRWGSYEDKDSHDLGKVSTRGDFYGGINFIFSGRFGLRLSFMKKHVGYELTDTGRDFQLSFPGGSSFLFYEVGLFLPIND